MKAVARIEALRIMWDRVALSLIAMVPVVQILLFGYAVNLNPKSVPIAIAGGSEPSVERATRIVGEVGYFTIIGTGLPSGAAERMVVEGKTLVGIELPPDIDGHDSRENASKTDGAENTDTPPSSMARVVADASDPAAVRPALAALETAYWRHAATAFSLGSGPTVGVRWLFNPEGRTAWAIIPGLVGVIVMISMLMLGALTLVRERERGTWEALLATPVDALNALVGKLTPYVLIGTLQGAVAIAVARELFHLPAAGGLWALLIALPVFALAHLVLGFGLSTLAESQMQAVHGAVFFYLPSMLLSGFMFPFQGMPGWAQAVGEVLPLTHFVRAMRGVLLKGEGGVLVGHEMWPVAQFALAAGIIGLAAYRRRLE